MESELVEKSLRSLTKYINRGITPVYTEGNGIVVLNQKCIRDGKISLEFSRNHNVGKRIVPNDKKIQKFDILVNSTGVGTLGRVAQKFDDKISTVDSHITIVRPNEQKVNPLYLGYLLKNNQSLIESLAEGSTGQTELSRTLLGDLSFDILSNKKDQEKIGEFMFLIDSKIDNNLKTNYVLESIAQTFFKSWFVDFDPVKSKIEAKENGEEPTLAALQILSGKKAEDTQNFAGAEYNELKAIAAIFPDELENSEIGWIPKGWSLTSLYETAEYVNGGAFRNGDFSPDKEGLPIIKIAELKSGISPQTQYTTNEVLEKYHINNGDMLYSWSGSPETSLDVFKWFGGEGWLNQHIFKINTKTKEQKVFVYFLLQHLKPQLIEIAKNKQTTGLGHVTIADMKRINVVMPNKKDLKLLMEKLIPLFDKSSNCMQENMVLGEQRDTLLPQLLSGKINFNM